MASSCTASGTGGTTTRAGVRHGRGRAGAVPSACGARAAAVVPPGGTMCGAHVCPRVVACRQPRAAQGGRREGRPLLRWRPRGSHIQVRRRRPRHARTAHARGGWRPFAGIARIADGALSAGPRVPPGDAPPGRGCSEHAERNGPHGPAATSKRASGRERRRPGDGQAPRSPLTGGTCTPTVCVGVDDAERGAYETMQVSSGRADHWSDPSPLRIGVTHDPCEVAMRAGAVRSGNLHPPILTIAVVPLVARPSRAGARLQSRRRFRRRSATGQNIVDAPLAQRLGRANPGRRRGSATPLGAEARCPLFAKWLRARGCPSVQSPRR